MPRQNRCTPQGQLEATEARGLFMGNRGGRLHRDDQTLAAARWKSKAWIICLLRFKDWHRTVMGPGYTEVFFLDEATALAAGHRPCYLCQRQRAAAFAAALAAGTGSSPKAPQIDAQLHKERRSAPQTLPFGAAHLPGTIIHTQGAPHLVLHTGLRRWSHHGYGPEIPLPHQSTPVGCLTPPTTRRAIAQGYQPVLHPSAQA